MPKWTEEQNRLLMECAQLGAKDCRDLIRRKFGVYRSVETTARQGRRLGLSMVKLPSPCPMCGSTSHVHPRTGLCAKHHYEYLEAQRYAQKAARRDPKADQEAEAAKREYNRQRRARQREQKKSCG